MPSLPRWTVISAAAALTMIGASEPLFARGGPPNLLNSPGYQRRLEESRQQLAAHEAQPAPGPVLKHGTKRHHHHHAAH